MPKVTQEYFDNKRKMIVDCTYKVCLRKPVEMVTISDVIAETGLSQGGIYRFYKDLDAILSDMIAGMRRDYNFTDSLDEVVADRLKKSPGASAEYLQTAWKHISWTSRRSISI